MIACTCGSAASHAIAARRTADDRTIKLWNDGSIAGALGAVVRGCARPRTAAARSLALAAGWLVMGEAELYDFAELPALIAAARAVVARHPLAVPGDLRAELSRRAQRQARPCPTWEHPHPGVRTWAFSRLSPLAGLVIWHERGRYSVLRRERRAAAGVRGGEVLIDTGAHATTVAGAYEAALELAPREVWP